MEIEEKRSGQSVEQYNVGKGVSVATSMHLF